MSSVGFTTQSKEHELEKLREASRSLAFYALSRFSRWPSLQMKVMAQLKTQKAATSAAYSQPITTY